MTMATVGRGSVVLAKTGDAANLKHVRFVLVSDPNRGEVRASGRLALVPLSQAPSSLDGLHPAVAAPIGLPGWAQGLWYARCEKLQCSDARDVTNVIGQVSVDELARIDAAVGIMTTPLPVTAPSEREPAATAASR